MRYSAILFTALGGLHAALALLPFKPIPPPVPGVTFASLLPGNIKVPTDNLTGAGNFTQYIDHANPNQGTFLQRFWWNATSWKGPGSPVIFFTPGEVPADEYVGYLTDLTLTGLLGIELEAAVVVVEHRNWGASLPTQIIDTAHLQQHTLENAVQDFVRFAQEVDFPFDKNHSSNAPQAAWVWTGGSYSGALAPWIEKLSPGTFWAYHASSAPVEAVYDYWSYFLPIQEGMPENCSADFQSIIAYVDETIASGNEEKIQSLKDSFGLGAVEHNDDFASSLSGPLTYWQEIQFTSGYSDFYAMCDAVEGVVLGQTEDVPGPEGVGLEAALANYASYFNNTYVPFTCASYGYGEWQDPLNVDCFNTYNASSPIYTDSTPGNPSNKQWYWLCCNQPFFYWQTGAPEGTSTLVSRYTTAEYNQRQCSLFFPTEDGFTFASNEGRTADDENALTDGWNFLNTTQLVWVNGGFDPWRSAGVSSELRPGGPLASRPGAPVFLIPGSRHANDLIISNGQANANVMAAIDGVVAQMKTWVGEFNGDKKLRRRAASRDMA